jgi:glutathione S-transferase
MLTVYGRATSSNVQTVMWTIAELGLDCERLDYGGAFGGNDTLEFLAMNPNGLVPVVIDGDGPPLWESPAVLRYLAARYGDEQFWPADPARRASQDIWAEWTKTTFYPTLIGQVFGPLVRLRPEQRNEQQIAAGIEGLKPLARMLDNRLADTAFIGGDAPSFADMMTGHLLYRYYTLPIDRAETPALDTYYTRLQAREAYRQHVMVSYESLRPSS